jgi:hypothetical protein
MSWRQEQRFTDVAEAENIAVFSRFWLADQRYDCMADQIPIGTQRDRDSRLNIQDILRTAEGTHIKIRVVFEMER